MNNSFETFHSFIISDHMSKYIHLGLHIALSQYMIKQKIHYNYIIIVNNLLDTLYLLNL